MSDYEEIEEEQKAVERASHLKAGDENAQKELESKLEGNIKSSGEKRDFGTGAHRDSNTKVHKGRMDLIPAVAMHRFARFLSDINYNPTRQGPRHALAAYNDAMQSMYLWLEGERMPCDMADAVKEKYGRHFEYDHLSNALVCCQEIMHMGEDLPLWCPNASPEYERMGTRFDQISPVLLRRVSIHYQLGGINYGDRNWELGMPAMVTWDSATRHFTNWLEAVLGDTEDHMAAVAWNIMCTMHTIEMINRGILQPDMFTPPNYRPSTGRIIGGVQPLKPEPEPHIFPGAGHLAPLKPKRKR